MGLIKLLERETNEILKKVNKMAKSETKMVESKNKQQESGVFAQITLLKRDMSETLARLDKIKFNLENKNKKVV